MGLTARKARVLYQRKWMKDPMIRDLLKKVKERADKGDQKLYVTWINQSKITHDQELFLDYMGYKVERDRLSIVISWI
jgi:hypothetical protein